MTDTTKKTTVSRPSLAISDPKELEILARLVSTEYTNARKNESTPDDELARLYDLRDRTTKAMNKAIAAANTVTTTSAPSTPASLAGEAATGKSRTAAK